MKKNYLYIDTETTGLDHKTCAVVEIGAVCNGKTFHTLVYPHSTARLDEKALEVSGLTMEKLKGAPDHITAVKMLCDFMGQFVDQYDKKDKLIMAGFNIGFDDEFLREMFLRAGNKFFGSYKWPTLYDVQVPAIAYLQNERPDMDNFKLGTVAKQLGIDLSEYKLHNALDDILITERIDSIVSNGCKCG